MHSGVNLFMCVGIYVYSFIGMCAYDDRETSLGDHTPNQYSTKKIYHFLNIPS